LLKKGKTIRIFLSQYEPIFKDLLQADEEALFFFKFPKIRKLRWRLKTPKKSIIVYKIGSLIFQ